MDEKAEWVSRVLGLDVALGRPTKDANDGPALAPGWSAAKAQIDSALAAVDQQIAALQKAIRRTDNDELLTISEIGLPEMVADFKPELLDALSAVGDGNTASLFKKGAALLQVVQRVGHVIGSDARIAACESNDFGVAVSIKATLTPALAAVSAAVQAGMKQ